MRALGRTTIAGLASLLAVPVAVVIAPQIASASVPEVHPDFDGDGYADLPIPAPGEDLAGAGNAGVVHVLYGSARGPRAHGSQRLSQAAPGAKGNPGDWELFGLDCGFGDFDGDGYDDLAVGILGDLIGGADRGGVQVFYGSADGLTTQGDVLLNEALPGFPGAPDPGDVFGFAVAAGDFDGDGRDDLAVGNPGEAWGGGDEYGAVYVFEGRTSGLSTAGVRMFSQRTYGISEEPGDGDRFGMSLASGDFDGNGRDDLAIGAPGEKIRGHDDAGVVHVLHGSSSGLNSARDELWTQAGPDVPGSIGTANAFGSSLAVGHLDGDERDDLAIGVTGDDIGTVDRAGSVIVLRGWEGGLTGLGARRFSYATAGVKGVPHSVDVFGYALAAADYDGDGHGDLAVSVPARKVAGKPLAGEVIVFRGGAALRPLAGPVRRLNQNSSGISGGAETNDHFSSYIAAGDLDGNGRDDLCVGVAGEDFAGIDSAGVAHVLFGRASGLHGGGSRTFSQDTNGIPDHAENGDVFGNQALA